MIPHPSVARCLAAVLLVSTAAFASDPAPVADPGHSHTLPPQAAAWVHEGEQRLQAGDTVAAQALFDQAAARAHSPVIEAGLLHAQMQAGDYRGALAFAAHVAGAHPQEPLGTLLYAWLLYVGAQAGQAQALIDRAALRWPSDTDVAALRAPMAVARPTAPLLAEVRLAPYPLGPQPAAPARVIASAVLIAPDEALAPLAALPQDAPLWLRDGLGRTQPARLVRSDPTLGIAVLRLAAPFAAKEAPLALAPRDAFPGSPAYVAGYGASADGLAQWPRMALGFVGTRSLGIEAPGTAPGGPVFNQAGQFIGMSVTAPDGIVRAVPLSALGALRASALAGATGRPVPAPLLAPDQVYETAMRHTLQVLGPSTAPTTTAP